MKVDILTKILNDSFNFNFFPDTIVDILKCIDTNSEIRFEKSYFQKKSGLMLKNSIDSKHLYISLFPSEEVIKYLEMQKIKDSYLIVKHPMDWEEFGRGFIPLSEYQIHILNRQRINLYCVHAPIDNSVQLSPSYNLALVMGGCIVGEINLDERNYGWVVELPYEKKHLELKNDLLKKLGLTKIQEIGSKNVKRLAVISGGGDNPDLIDIALQKNCDTYITGILSFLGSDYAREHNPKFVEELRKNKMNAFGISHLVSEIYCLNPLKSYLENLTSLPVTIIHENNKFEEISEKLEGIL